MRSLVSAAILVATSSLLVAPAAGQARPADPALLHFHHLEGSDSQQLNLFGNGIATSHQTLAVGAPMRDNYTGAVYVFVKTSSGWTQQAELTAGDAAPDTYFGDTVAISDNTLVVGAASADSPDLIGTAYIFQRTGTTWTQTAELPDPGQVALDDYARAVAVSGHTVVVGALGVNDFKGVAYVYTLRAGKWVLQQTLQASDGVANDCFGWSLTVSDGTIAVGAPCAGGSQGKVYVFTKTGSAWPQTDELSDPNPDGVPTNSFGAQVGLDPAGQVLVVSAIGEQAAYVYFGVDGVWENYARLAAADSGGDFGDSVAVSANEILIGSPHRGYDTGAVFSFMMEGGVWDYQSEVTQPNPIVGDRFGYGIALLGHIALISAPWHNRDKGIVYAVSGAPF